LVLNLLERVYRVKIDFLYCPGFHKKPQNKYEQKSEVLFALWSNILAKNRSCLKSCAKNLCEITLQEMNRKKTVDASHACSSSSPSQVQQKLFLKILLISDEGFFACLQFSN
jgi:hypothetical protein